MEVKLQNTTEIINFVVISILIKMSRGMYQYQTNKYQIDHLINIRAFTKITIGEKRNLLEE